MQACWALIARLEALEARYQHRPDVVAVLAGWRETAQDGVMGLGDVAFVNGELDRLERTVA